MMELARILLIVAVVYVAFVAVMEIAIGFLQLDMEGGVRLTTTDTEGNPTERELAVLRLDGKLYIASNHWLRGWYHQALAEPNVRGELDGVQDDYRAVPITGDERARVSDAYRMGFFLRFLCGFAPSRFLRLDPV